jgi:hypothetical protein
VRPERLNVIRVSCRQSLCFVEAASIVRNGRKRTEIREKHRKNKGNRRNIQCIREEYLCFYTSGRPKRRKMETKRIWPAPYDRYLFIHIIMWAKIL